MSFKNSYKFLALFLALTGGNFTLQQSYAQGLGNSPYSSLGIGELYGDSFSDNAGTGQAGVSSGSGFQINNLNPALWVRNKFTTLDFGVIGQYNQIQSGNKSQRNAGGNLGYVALSFPVSTKWNLGVSLKPYSYVDYSNEFIRTVPGTPSSAYYSTTGKGGINKVSFTNAFQIGKYLSVGLESSYLFGNIQRSSTVQLPIIAGEYYPLPTGGDYQVAIIERNTVSDFSFKGGLALRVPIKKENKLFWNLGGTYSLGSKLNTTETTSFELSQNGTNIVAPDTLSKDLGGSMTLPALYQVGTSFEWPFKLTVSADYSYQDWSKYKGFSGSNDGLQNVSRFHLGAEYLPNFTSLKYFDVVRYRLGFSHGQMPYSINGSKLNDTNISLGITFPMGGRYSNYISVAFVGGQRGNSSAGLIRERYGKMVLGITLMDRWFVKQKLE
ncbi:outer membrane protein transport protein [Dyadobacter tibetensis]|uniref:outer membrane protein transport protein n=1 Tax=Dyadobacter tibetensis TaxID=1211851 RepID=UPI0004B4C4A4|nr:outer membrane protein transport protein [Dyadobacter tibetensis]